MKELSEILAALRVGGEWDGVSLVTVVAVEGSTYRRPGARMLVTPMGRVGSISGGCLEDDVCRKAWWLAEHGPAAMTYDTGIDEEPGDRASYAVGCRGRVTVLIERLDRGLPPYLSFVEACQSAGRPCAVATVIGLEGLGSPGWPKIGDRVTFAAGGAGHGEAGAPPHLRADVDAALAASQSRHVSYEVQSGRMHMLIEVVPPPVHLLIFGAGHDAEPLVAMAKELGWRVSLVARRLLQGTRVRFGRADHVLQLSEETMRSIRGAGLSTRGAAIIMSHDYAADLAALSQVVASQVPYVGVLGPRHRTDTLISDIAAEGGEVTHEDMVRIHAPVGLDIGAESPEQVALAVIAEVQAFYARREGGPLRDRDGPIHDPVEGGRPTSVTIDASCGLDSGT